MVKKLNSRRNSEPSETEIPPGMKLLRVLRGHSSWIGRISWSPDGRLLASPSDDKTVRIWNMETGQTEHVFSSNSAVLCAEWSPNGDRLATGHLNGEITIWPLEQNSTKHFFKPHNDEVRSLSWSPKEKQLVSGSNDQTICIWNTQSWELVERQSGHESHVTEVTWDPSGLLIASASDDGTIGIWNTAKQLFIKRKHGGFVISVAWSPNGKFLASASNEATIYIWDPPTGKQVHILEGHQQSVRHLAFSSSSRLLASKAWDNTVRLWNTNNWKIVATLVEHPFSYLWYGGIAFHPTKSSMLATLGERDHIIRIWELDLDYLIGQAPVEEIVSYANSRVVLIGDTGVGKSGLTEALIGQPFRPTESTHGRKIYTLEDKVETLPDGRREHRETLLWDLAGQPGYRLIHQLNLIEVAVALMVFDSRSGDPFTSVHYWNKALDQALQVQGNAAVPMCKLLIAARADRGGIPISQERIDDLIAQLDLDGYFETSAKEGWSIAELKAAILENIDWDALPKVSSTEIFVSIKDFLTHTKERGTLLIPTVDTLYALYLASEYAPKDNRDVRAEFETVIGRVESRGLIRRLSFGGFVLLQPELLDSYASSLVFAARDETDGLGSISEDDARVGRFRMPEDERIAHTETEKLLLIATVEDLLRHEIALKDESDLIFPSQFLRERPDLPDPEGKAVVFTFEGAVQNIYTRLAVRLSRSNLFRREDMWRNAATYTSGIGSCGMWLRELPDGGGELTLFYTPNTSEETRFHFEQYVETMLSRWTLQDTLMRRRMFVCENCGETMNDRHVQARLARGHNTMECPVCDSTIYLLDGEERLATVLESKVHAIDRAADRGRDLAVAEYTIKGKEAVNDFDVFLSHNGRDKDQIIAIAEDLRREGLLPWLDVWELPPGQEWQPLLASEMEKCKTFAYFVGPNGPGRWQQRELQAFMTLDRDHPTVIPVFLPTAPTEAEVDLGAFLKTTTWVDFRRLNPDPLQQLIWGITGKRGRI